MVSRGLLLSIGCFIISNIFLYWLAGGILIHKEKTPLSVQESDPQQAPAVKATVGQRTLRLYEQHELQGGRYYHYDAQNNTDFELEFAAISPIEQQEVMLEWPVCHHYRAADIKNNGTNPVDHQPTNSTKKNARKNISMPEYIMVTAGHGRLKLSQDARQLESLCLNSENPQEDEIQGVAIATAGFIGITTPPVTIRGWSEKQPNAQELLKLETANLSMNFLNQDIQQISNDCFVQFIDYNLDGKEMLHFQGVGLESDWTLQQIVIKKQVRVMIASQLWQPPDLSSKTIPVSFWHSQCQGKVTIQYLRSERMIYILQEDGVVVTGNQGKLQCQQLEVWLVESQNLQQRWQPKRLLAKGKVEWSDGTEEERNFAKAELCEMLYASDGSIKTIFQENPKIVLKNITGFTLISEESRKQLAKQQQRYRWQTLEAQCRDKMIWTKPSSNNHDVEYLDLLGDVHIKQVSEKIKQLELDCQYAKFCLQQEEGKNEKQKTASLAPLWLKAYRNVKVRHDRGTGQGEFFQWYNLTSGELSRLLTKPHQGLTPILSHVSTSASSRHAQNPVLYQISQDAKLAALLYSIAWSPHSRSASWIGLSGQPVVFAKNIAMSPTAWQGEFLPSSPPASNKTSLPSPRTKPMATAPGAKKISKPLENLTIQSQLPLIHISYRSTQGREDIYYARKNVRLIRYIQPSPGSKYQSIGKMSCQSLLAQIQPKKNKGKTQLQYLEALEQVQFNGPEASGGADQLLMRIQNKQEIFRLIGNAWTQNQQGFLRGDQFRYNLTTQLFQAWGRPVLLSGQEFGATGNVFHYDVARGRLELTGQRAQVWQPEPIHSASNPVLSSRPPIPSSQNKTNVPQLPKNVKKRHSIYAQRIIYWREQGKTEAYNQVQLDMTAEKGTSELSLWQNANQNNVIPSSSTQEIKSYPASSADAARVNQTAKGVNKRYRLTSDQLKAELDTVNQTLRFFHAQGRVELYRIFPQEGEQEKMQGDSLVYTPLSAQLLGKPGRVEYGDSMIESPQFDFIRAEQKVSGIGPIHATLVNIKKVQDKPGSAPTSTSATSKKYNEILNSKDAMQVYSQGPMEFWQQKNYLELRQNVQVTMSQARLDCQSLRVFFEQQKIKNIIADRQVVLQSQGNTANAEQLRWNDQSDRAFLIGNPNVLLKTKDFTLHTPVAWYDIPHQRFLTRGPNILLETQPQSPTSPRK